MPTPSSAPQPRRTAATDRPPTRRQAVRLAVRLALLGGAAVTVSACSAEQREALADVDPREVRLDRADAVVERPRPSEREQRRRAVLAGAVAPASA